MYYDDKLMNYVVTIQKYLDHSLSIQDVMKHLGCSERSVYRYAARYKEHGPPGLIHGLRWKKSNNRNKKREQLEKYAKQERFSWFWPTLLSEKLEQLLWYRVPIESLRRRMSERWVWIPRKPYKIRRSPRKRKNWYGMMIQFDGSYHDWLENGEERCLLLGVDDATGKVMHVKFTDNESIAAVISYREEYFKLYGKPWIIYLDRHASYKVNHRKDQFDWSTQTRFQTAMQYLWVQVIFAKSAEWKWRVERKFALFQDRGIKELRLLWMKDYVQAEKQLQEVIIPELNRKFSCTASVAWDYHIPLTGKDTQQLEWYFAKKTERKMNKIGVVNYQWNAYVVAKWQVLNGTRNVCILETHLWNMQIWNWETNLRFEKMSY